VLREYQKMFSICVGCDLNQGSQNTWHHDGTEIVQTLICYSELALNMKGWFSDTANEIFTEAQCLVKCI
jgi:hypothetical protein